MKAFRDCFRGLMRTLRPHLGRILVSGLSAWLLMRHRGDINTRAAFLHMATDSLLSLGIVIAGVIISRTGLHVIDPAISLVVAAVILFNTLRLLLDALRTLFRK